MSGENNLQSRLLKSAEEQNIQLTRIADSLEELLSMIKGVQPAELAKKAREHKKAQANLKKKNKGGKKNE
ncbi:MAG: hypothetical protein CMB45_06095 [Euryarchaeota archaeon]|nr:hypothetical protein [Euryarchaeota archaeon]